MTLSKSNELKQKVRERYSAHARGAVACCGPEDSHAASQYCGPDVYGDANLDGLTPEAIATSAGCGNPTALADLKPSEVVLDLGSGGGINCFLAAQAVGPEGRALGVDMTLAMVELARKNARKMGVTNVEFHLAEMEELPLAPETVDVVISNCVVCLSPDKDAVFRETFRVLKPRGRIHLSDMVLVGELPKEIRDDPQRWAECVAGAEPKKTYWARLDQAEFRDVTIEAEESYAPEPGLDTIRSMQVQAIKPA